MASMFTGALERYDHGCLLFTTDTDPGIPEARQDEFEMPGLWAMWFEPHDENLVRAVYRLSSQARITVTFEPPRTARGHPVAISVAAAV